MDLSAYDYELPKELIAQHPSAHRDESKLMVLRRADGALEHRTFRDLPELLSANDLLVLNDTKVCPARLIGQRHTGGRVDALFVQHVEPGVWEALVHARRRLQPGEVLDFEEGRLRAVVRGRRDSGEWLLDLGAETDLHAVLAEVGRAPLPPYIKRSREHDPFQAADRDRYQTVYARSMGAIAAPTAGLHFTEELLDRLRQKGVETVNVTLHVGLGTFRPIKVERVEDHEMHVEQFEVGAEAAETLIRARREGRRIIAVGTTSCRVLETLAARDRIEAMNAETGLFIHPPYEFQLTDALVTNFHLPRTSLLLLVSAFAGREHILNAYETAKRLQYRFYSYGDAMLII